MLPQFPLTELDLLFRAEEESCDNLQQEPQAETPRTKVFELEQHTSFSRPLPHELLLSRSLSSPISFPKPLSISFLILLLIRDKIGKLNLNDLGCQRGRLELLEETVALLQEYPTVDDFKKAHSCAKDWSCSEALALNNFLFKMRLNF